MKRFSGLSGRWLKNTLCVVTPLVLVFTTAVCALSFLHCYSDMRRDLSGQACTTAELLSLCTDGDSCLDYVRNFEASGNVELQLLDPDGWLEASSLSSRMPDAPGTDEIPQVLTTGSEATYLGKDPHTGTQILAVSAPITSADGEIAGIVRVVVQSSVIHLQALRTTLAALAWCIPVVLAVMVSSQYFLRSVLRPLAEITAKAKRIAGGTYGVQIETRYDDEIGELARSVNDLSSQISQNEKAQTEFISSLSHELRTPLTAITGWSETILSQEQLDFEETRRGMFIINREAQRLTEMVLELLDFTRIQDGHMTLNVEPTDIRGEFEDTVFMYGSRLRQEGIQINYQDNEDDIPDISCDPQRMRQVFLNILDNAAKHGGEGGRIDASIHATDVAVVIRIRDYGPGIPEDEIPLVKKKFYKGSSKARGSGIGLAVCDEIVQMHGGTLRLSNADGGGTMVSVYMPIKQ